MFISRSAGAGSRYAQKRPPRAKPTPSGNAAIIPARKLADVQRSMVQWGYRISRADLAAQHQQQLDFWKPLNPLLIDFDDLLDAGKAPKVSDGPPPAARFASPASGYGSCHGRRFPSPQSLAQAAHPPPGQQRSRYQYDGGFQVVRRRGDAAWLTDSPRP